MCVPIDLALTMEFYKVEGGPVLRITWAKKDAGNQLHLIPTDQ